MPAALSMDLLETVVDTLAGDKPTLSACALASSVLRRRARHHLLSDVTITTPAHATALTNLLDADPLLGGSVIRTLTLSVNARLGASWLCALLPRLPNLEALTLKDINFNTAKPERDGAGTLRDALPKSLRHLALQHCEFESEAGLIALISAASGLRSLDIALYHWAPPLEPASEYESYAQTIELEHFRLVRTSLEPEACRESWLSALALRRLATLELALIGAKDMLFWQARIDQAGSVMRRLVLVDYNETVVGLVLSPLTMLRTLVIHSDLLSRSHSGRQSKLWLPLLGMLETVSSPSLERVIIMPDHPTPAFAFGIDWQTLRAACEAVRVCSPRLRVVFGLLSNASVSDWNRLLVECESIIGEAIVANGLEEMVSTERMRMGQWDE